MVPSNIYTDEHLEGIRQLIAETGYAFDGWQSIFYSIQDPWQRKMGYCSLYDYFAAPLGMVFDCEPVRFQHNGKRWLIEFWKGQYGITVGGEIGIYNTTRPNISIPGVFDGTFYDCAEDNERLDMKFTLVRKGAALFTRSDYHWWLTGFILGDYSRPSELTMKASLVFTDPNMRDAFLAAIYALGYTESDVGCAGNTVSVTFAKPKSRQPATRHSLFSFFTMLWDRTLVSWLRRVTKGASDVYDVLMMLRVKTPFLFRMAVNMGRQQKQYKSMALPAGRPADKPAGKPAGKEGKKVKARKPAHAGRIDRVYQGAPVLAIDDFSKIAVMSDCHRGSGNLADNFFRNHTICHAALNSYDRLGYTYIELGDGDELWENKRMAEINAAHSDIFRLLAQFYRDKRLWMLYGNHDLVKKYRPALLDSYCDPMTGKCAPLFPGAKAYEGLLLRYSPTRKDFFLLHGHQVDFLNDTLWRLARFLVRYVWRPLELVGIKNPTSAAQNNKVKIKIEKRLMQWAKEKNMPVISGHTHRPVFPGSEETKYFNDGCCVHPEYITAIEISQGKISLVKWGQKARDDGTVYIGKDVIAGPVRLTEYLL